MAGGIPFTTELNILKEVCECERSALSLSHTDCTLHAATFS